MGKLQAKMLGWNDVQDAAKELFNIWTHRQELVWAEGAWAILIDAGLPVYTTEYGRCRASLYLLGLCCLYFDFCWLGCDERQIPNYLDAAGLLGLTPFRLGQIVAVDPDFLDGDDDEVFYDALEAYAKYQQRVIHGPLLRGYGSSLEFAQALWLSVKSQDDEDEIVRYEGVGGFWHPAPIPRAQLQVYAWIEDGCYALG